jgi:hypothetical protein
MSRNFRSAFLAVIAIAGFGASFLSTFKVDNNVISDLKQQDQVISSVNAKSALQSPTMESVVNQSEIILPAFTLDAIPKFSYNFGGEKANAAVWNPNWTKPLVQGVTYVYNGVTAVVTLVSGYQMINTTQNDIFSVPNNLPMEWNEASDLCNRKYGTLIWRNNLKTCIPR